MRVVVIGAGVAGLGIGWRLARAGAEVTVLERAQVGNGATTASAGMLAAATELGAKETAETAFARRADVLWPDFAAELEAESGVPVGYSKTGALQVRMPADPQDAPLELDAAAALGLEPLLAPELIGATLAKDEGRVDSQALCRALAVSFVRAGGTLLSNEAAVRFIWHKGRLGGIATPFATYSGDVFVLATGAWSSRLEGLPPEAVPPVVPVKGEIVVLTPPEGGALPRHAVWGNGIYVVPRGGRLLVGATMEDAGFDTTLTSAAVRWLYRQSTGLMPSLADWRMREHWAGLRPASPDGLPILGESAVEGLYVATGQYRNGILFAPAIADVLSRLILERLPVDPAFDPKRFGAEKGKASVKETAHRDVGIEAGEWHTGY